ncbi:MAG: spore photoproduct lyase family protein [bacterium]
MELFVPQLIYLESMAKEEPLAREILLSLSGARVYEIRDHRRLDSEAVPLKAYDPGIKQRALVLAHNPGPFIRPFRPLAEDKAGADLFISHANGCPFDCQYCFLQCYFSHGAPVLFVNQQELLQELSDRLEAPAAAGQVTYHAGELSDALALERWSGFAARAVELFRGHPEAVLELRTKCVEVEPLLPDHPPENVVCSWTLTPVQAWRRFEAGTPDPRARLATARACREKGYRIGVRLDPALLFPGWQEGYEELMRLAFQALPPGEIDSFVVGGFRYPAGLAARIRERFPESTLLLEELVPCPDGKHRYFRPLRVALYRKILREIRRYDEQVPVRLCMESERVRGEAGIGCDGRTEAG